MKPIIALLLLCTLSALTLADEKAEADARAACIGHVEHYLGRAVTPTKQSTWKTTEAPAGIWMVEARYTDRGVAGTMWCLMKDTSLGFAEVRTEVRYQDALDASRAIKTTNKGN